MGRRVMTEEEWSNYRLLQRGLTSDEVERLIDTLDAKENETRALRRMYVDLAMRLERTEGETP